MKGTIVSYHSADIEDLSIGPKTQEFEFSLEFEVAPIGGSGADVFEVLVLSYSALGRRLRREGNPILARHMVLVDRYDWDKIALLLEGVVGSVQGTSWEHLSELLARRFKWEHDQE